MTTTGDTGPRPRGHLAVLSAADVAAHERQAREDAAAVRASVAHVAAGRLDDALDVLSSLVAVPTTPVRQRAVAVYAGLCAQARHPAEGLAALDAAAVVGGEPSALVLMLRAQLLRQAGRAVDAVVAARRAHELEPSVERALVLCACLRDAATLAEAKDAANAALALAVDDADRAACLGQLAAISATLGDLVGAREHLGTLDGLARPDDAAWYLHRAHALAHLGEADAARDAVGYARALDAMLCGAWLNDDVELSRFCAPAPAGLLAP